MVTEQPFRFMRYLSATIAKAVIRAVTDHERRMHIPEHRTERVSAVPFSDFHLDDAILAHMVEVLEIERCSIGHLAWRFGYPRSLVRRELADYNSRFKAFLRERAASK